MNDRDKNKEQLFTEEDMYKAFQLGGWKQLYFDVDDVGGGALQDKMSCKGFDDLIDKIKNNGL